MRSGVNPAPLKTDPSTSQNCSLGGVTVSTGRESRRNAQVTKGSTTVLHRGSTPLASTNERKTMYRVILIIGERQEFRDFSSRTDAVSIVNDVQDHMGERGFKYLRFDRESGFYMYVHEETGTLARVGIGVLESERDENEPFLRKAKT